MADPKYKHTIHVVWDDGSKTVRQLFGEEQVEVAETGHLFFLTSDHTSHCLAPGQWMSYTVEREIDNETQ